MRGDDRVRFCDVCAQNVFNLSAMARDEAEWLVAEHEGKLCVRFYRRADGTVQTEDCAPSRVARLKKEARRRLTLAGTALAGLVTAAVGGLGAFLTIGGVETPCDLPPVTHMDDDFVMGEMEPVVMGALEPPLVDPLPPPEVVEPPPAIEPPRVVDPPPAADPEPPRHIMGRIAPRAAEPAFEMGEAADPSDLDAMIIDP